MTLSRAELELLSEELATLAGRAAIQRVYEVDQETRIFRLRVPGETHLWLLSLEDELTRAHIVQDRPEQPDKPTSFTMLLRKWVEGAHFREVSMLNDDRILRLDLSIRDPESETAEPPRIDVALIAELFGRNPNLFLVDEDEEILGQQRQSALGSRDFERGDPYELPPAPPEYSKGDRVRWNLDDAAPEQFERSQIVEINYRQLAQQHRRQELFHELQTRLDRQLDRLERRIGHVEEDLERAENAEQYKRRGELLQSAWGDVEKGADQVEVPDFYEQGQPPVEIPLDPSKTLQENIEHYFHEYKRYTKATDRILERLEESERELRALREAREEFERLEDVEDVLELRSRLGREGLLPAPTSDAAGSGRPGERKPYREFQAGSGAQILVGRGAEDNDTVSTAVARGRDMWLHARDFAGAHVILRMEKKLDAPRGQDLLDAATLAAWFSKGRRDTLVDVTYTRAKYVRKPKGFPPGRVTVADASTIAVRIEDERIERLLASEARDNP